MTGPSENPPDKPIVPDGIELLAQAHDDRYPRGDRPPSPWTSETARHATEQRVAHRQEIKALEKKAELARREGYNEALADLAEDMQTFRKKVMSQALAALDDPDRKHGERQIERGMKNADVIENRLFGTATQHSKSVNENLNISATLDDLVRKAADE